MQTLVVILEWWIFFSSRLCLSLNLANGNLDLVSDPEIAHAAATYSHSILLVDVKEPRKLSSSDILLQ